MPQAQGWGKIRVSPERAHRWSAPPPAAGYYGAMITAARYAGRIAALDIARGLAILGMFVAHVGPDRGGLPGWLMAVADGRSSILFATLAGVSLAILTGRNVPFGGVELLQAKIRIFTRAAMLLAISGLLAMMNDIVALILAAYAVWFVLAIPFLRWSPKRLFIMAGVSWLIGPLITTYLVFLLDRLGMTSMADASALFVEALLTGSYPGLIYMGFVLAGLGIGRLDLSDRTVAATLTPVGASLALVGYGSAFLLTRLGAGPPADDYGYEYTDVGDQGWRTDGMGPEWDPYIEVPDVGHLFGAEPHTGTVFEAVGSGGFAIAVIGLLLLGGPILGRILYPIAAVGSMPLSAYSFHIIAIWLIPAMVFPDSYTPLLWLTLVTLVACSLWLRLIGRGPLERLLHWTSMRAARISPPEQPGPRHGTPQPGPPTSESPHP